MTAPIIDVPETIAWADGALPTADLHGFLYEFGDAIDDEVTYTCWRKADIAPEHWQRLLTIAPRDPAEPKMRGFLKASMVIVAWMGADKVWHKSSTCQFSDAKLAEKVVTLP